MTCWFPAVISSSRSPRARARASPSSPRSCAGTRHTSLPVFLSRPPRTTSRRCPRRTAGSRALCRGAARSPRPPPRCRAPGWYSRPACRRSRRRRAPRHRNRRRRGPVGDGGRRGEAAAPVAGVGGRALPGRAPPEDLSGGRVKGQHLERVLAVRPDAVGMDEVLPGIGASSASPRARPRPRSRWSGRSGCPTRSARSSPGRGSRSSRPRFVSRSTPGQALLLHDPLAVGPAPARPAGLA